ncbi:HEAT repeat domain-containing protein [Sulfuricystis multivorans]|uniref:HEAT repeat domain-containing protein n=1 Tax=Sulfuricystis multivorans TaxID=2211108 RepID=UPI000F83B515|nr:HEAT repeat domain-containing protein [Sulfuricystis multivorans]
MNFGYPIASDATRALLRASMRDRAEQFAIWLLEGRIKDVFAVVERIPAALADLLPIVADPEANLNVRFGASAVLERYAGKPPLKALIPALGMLTGHGDARVRADACHLLGLTHSPAAIKYLEARRDDPDPDVREIVAESLAELQSKEE